MKINAVGGQIDTANMGKTLMHEHLVCGFGGWEGDTMLGWTPRREIIAACVDRIEELKSAGYSTILDPCPNDLGRDIDVMGETVAATGFNVMFAVGLYEEKFAGAYWREKTTADPDAVKYITEMYVREIVDGVGSTGLKPSVIKLANGPAPFPHHETVLMDAAAAAAIETGVPIITHTDAVDGEKQLAYMVGRGVAPERIIIGHSCGCTDHAYHKMICDGGAYIGFDRFGITRFMPDEDRVQSMVKLIEADYAKQIIVSHDCVFHLRGQMGTKERNDAAHSRRPIHFERVISPMLRELGVSQATIDSILIDNPKSYFEGKQAQGVKAAA